MKRWIPGFALVVLTIVGIFPFLPPAKFYFSADGFAHLFRFFDFDRAIHQGVIYPRWASDAAYGYGYPVFNFYSPLSYFTAEFLHLLGASVPQALVGTFAISIAIALSGAYLMGADLFGAGREAKAAGFLTAGAYVFFPYFLLDIYVRGALGEAFAAAILPWLMWTWRRVLTRQTLGVVVLNALGSAILVLSHNLIAYMAVPLLSAYTLWELLHLPSSQRVNAFVRLVASVLLGTLLSAFYWVPTLAELPFIAGGRSSKQLVTILQNSFLAPAQVIQLSLLYAYGEDPYPLALVPMGLSVVAFVLALLVRHRVGRSPAVFFFLATIVETVLLLDWTQAIWLGVPLLSTSQFAWRLSVFIGLSVAITIGSLASALPYLLESSKVRWRWTVLPSAGLFSVIPSASLVVVLIWVGLAKLAPTPMDNPRGELTIGQMARFEVNARSFGFVWLNEYLPLTVKEIPNQLNLARTDAVPPSIILSECSPLQCSFTVSTERSAPIFLRTFYFPGWQATIDDQPVPAYPSTPMGLVTVDVPGGRHRVVLAFGNTLPRQLGACISVIGVIALLVLTAFVFRRREREARMIAGVIGIVFAIAALPAFIALTAKPLPLQSVQIDVSPELRLIGWRSTQTSDSVELQVYWQAKQPLQDRPFAWRIVDDVGRVWASREQLARYGTGFPAAWQPNEIVEDHYDLPLDSRMPPGRYSLQVAYPSDSRFVSVSTLQIERSNLAATDEPTMTHRVDALVGDRIRLVGYDAPSVVNSGEAFSPVLYWQAERDAHEDLTVFMQLLDADGHLIAQHDELTDNGFNPTMLWHAGKIISDRRTLVLPKNIEPGLYRLVAGMYRFQTLERLSVVTRSGAALDDFVELNSIKVPINAQSIQPARRLDVSLGSAIRLLGFDLSVQDERGSIMTPKDLSVPLRLPAQSNQVLALKLYWRADAQINTDSKVFVHIVDADGKLVAQQDQIPVNGRYSTRIWSLGEQVPDLHRLPLTLPLGTYRIVVGMYDANSGERLNAIDSNGLELPDRQIEISQVELVAR